MTVPAAPRVQTYPAATGNGPFGYSFPVSVDNSGLPGITVTKVATNGTRTVLTYPGGYAFALVGGGQQGGTVSPVAALAGETLVIEGKTPVTQDVPYRNQGDFFPEKHEKSYDKLTLIAQENASVNARTPKLRPETSVVGDVFIADPLEGALVGWQGNNLVNYTTLQTGVFTAFYQNGSGNVSVGRPGNVISGFKLDVNGNLWVQGMASINTGGDTTGTDSINTYAQVDMYQPNSAQGTIGASSVSGPSISTSRGTGTTPLINLANDLIGGVTYYGYSGASPAYNAHAGIFARMTGATANNLGGQLEFYTKANAGAMTLAMTIDNLGLSTFAQIPLVSGNGSLVTTTAAQSFSTGKKSFGGGTFEAVDLNGGQFGGFRNRIINGAMAVSQEFLATTQTFTAGAALAYCVDQFYGYCTGANITGAQVGTIGQYRYRFTGAASNTGVGFGTRLESVNTADLASAANNVAISVKLSSSSLTNIGWALYYASTTDSFGTLASPTRTLISSGNFTINATEATYAAIATMPSGLATTGLELVFTGGALLAGQTLTIGDVQLEQGSVATPFERRSFTTELDLCQRYFEKSFAYSTLPVQNCGTAGPVFPQCNAASTGGTMGGMVFKYRKRATPTITTFNPLAANAQPRNLNVSADCSAISVLSPYDGGFYFTYTTSAGSGAGQGNSLHFTANARL